jgi:F0F1-type ATP synthase alpha subunit
MVLVGDGIARVYRLNKIQVGKMVELASGVKGMTLNLENDNVRIVIFGSDIAIKEGDIVKHTRFIMDVLVGKALLGCVFDALGVLIDGKGVLNTAKQRCVKVKALGIIARKYVHKPMQTGLKGIDNHCNFKFVVIMLLEPLFVAAIPPQSLFLCHTTPLLTFL